ncbi:MAG: 2-hydroxyglutaryl-CoA dehydratase, partial [Lachnospiraceae bacterium]|nr:2-hydroxyglutaryl-CoA dehydratase [Lachnospiraceae bacterium]
LKYTPKFLLRALESLIYGDVLMRVLYRMRPYEKEAGSANALYERWNKKLSEDLKHPTIRKFKKNCREIVKDFDALPIDETLKKPRVGIVGEILVKFQPTANNHLVELLEQEGAEAVCPDLIDFFLYTCYDGEVKSRLFGKSRKEARYNRLAINLIEHFRKAAQEALAKSKHFERANFIDDMQKLSAPIVSEANMTGEGWFLTAEMIELIESGTPNIVCAQPFACLPNHIVGKGVIKALRARFPDSNIVAVDYDPGASEVNQLNRIKLMLSVAQKKAADGIGTR